MNACIQCAPEVARNMNTEQQQQPQKWWYSIYVTEMGFTSRRFTAHMCHTECDARTNIIIDCNAPSKSISIPTNRFTIHRYVHVHVHGKSRMMTNEREWGHVISKLLEFVSVSISLICFDVRTKTDANGRKSISNLYSNIFSNFLTPRTTSTCTTQIMYNEINRHVYQSRAKTKVKCRKSFLIVLFRRCRSLINTFDAIESATCVCVYVCSVDYSVCSVI